MNGRLRRRLSWKEDDRGALAVIVAVSLVAIFASAALAIDAGNLWTSRRDLITATDASALAAAGYIAKNGMAACSDGVVGGAASAAGVSASSYLTSNRSSATLDPGQGFAVTPYQGSCANNAGEVKVAAHQPVTLQFAPTLGISPLQSVQSSSIAEWGPLGSVQSLRPIGICVDNPNIQDWLSFGAAAGSDPDQSFMYRAKAGTGPNYPAASLYPGANNGSGQIDVVSHIDFTSVGGTVCATGKAANGAGNWGWLALDGSQSNSYPDGLAGWIKDGYNPLVTPTAQITGSTGVSGNSVDQYLNDITCSPSTPTQNCITFPIVIYSSLTGTGANTTFTGQFQLCVALRDHANITGSGGSFDFEFLFKTRCNLQGDIVPNPDPLAPIGISLCGGGGFNGITDNKCGV